MWGFRFMSFPQSIMEVAATELFWALRTLNLQRLSKTPVWLSKRLPGNSLAFGEVFYTHIHTTLQSYLCDLQRHLSIFTAQLGEFFSNGSRSYFDRINNKGCPLGFLNQLLTVAK